MRTSGAEKILTQWAGTSCGTATLLPRSTGELRSRKRQRVGAAREPHFLHQKDQKPKRTRDIEEISAELSESKDAGRLIGSVKRHAPDELSTFLMIPTTVLNNSYTPLSASSHDSYGVELNQKLLSKTLSIPIEAPINSDTQFPTDVAGLDEQLHKLSQITNVDIVGFEAEHSDEEIQLARNELALFIEAVSAIELESQKKFGRSAGAKPVLWSNQTQEGQVNMLLGWLFQRLDPAMRENIAELNAKIVEQIKAKPPPEMTHNLLRNVSSIQWPTFSSGLLVPVQRFSKQALSCIAQAKSLAPLQMSGAAGRRGLGGQALLCKLQKCRLILAGMLPWMDRRRSAR